MKAFSEENRLQRKSAVWKSASKMALNSFPTLDEKELRNLTCGSYQLKLSSSYIQEHIDGGSDIFFHEEDETLLRVKIQSRHTSSKSTYCGSVTVRVWWSHGIIHAGLMLECWDVLTQCRHHLVS